jgi:putative RNA 2'-phosphotransferase
MSKFLKDIGRYMSLLLRHKPEKEHLNIDSQGYVLVDELIEKLKITKDDLNWIIDNNDKKRFVYNSDKTMIRAAQGHSISVDLKMKRILPPDVLYHGTSIVNAVEISKGGLKKMGRNHVHLTDDKSTAYSVGMRYAKYKNKIWMITIDANHMNEDGFEFFKSENSVYLTEEVPSKYFI